MIELVLNIISDDLFKQIFKVIKVLLIFMS